MAALIVYINLGMVFFNQILVFADKLLSRLTIDAKSLLGNVVDRLIGYNE